MKRLLFAIIQLAQQLLARLDRRERKQDEERRQREINEAYKDPASAIADHFNGRVQRAEQPDTKPDATETDKAND